LTTSGSTSRRSGEAWSPEALRARELQSQREAR
jgi:hypothetical protein